MTFSEAIARHLPRMVFGWLTGDALANHRQFTLAGKHVAAQWYYQTKLRDVPPSLDNDGSAAR